MAPAMVGAFVLPIVGRLEKLAERITSVSDDHLKFYASQSSESASQIRACLDRLLLDLDAIASSVRAIDELGAKFDFDSETPGNGYRSFLVVTEACFVQLALVLHDLQAKRSSPVFKKASFVKELVAWVEVVESLNWMQSKLQLLYSWCKPGSLFPSEYHSAAELVQDLGSFEQCCFYGRCIGFQYSPSMRRLLTFISTLLASYSEIYFHPGCPNALQRAFIWTSKTSKYSLNPEQRAKRILNASQNCTVDFIKSFWDLNENEFVHQFPRIFSFSADVNEVIQIPTEPLQIPKSNGDKFTVPIPMAHIGRAPVKTRLISTKLRVGMVNDLSIWRKLKFTKVHDKATGLVIHCHGGGFVSHSSASQEVFLLEWASLLDVPILSIDYSLAPEAPYPRALEEIFYVYCWALQNAGFLGTTAERVVFVGDSAGGNLVVGVTMRCIETGIRIPDGVFASYTPFLISFTPSPSRMLCLMDPLLPFPFMMRCLGAYAGHTEVETSHVQTEKSESTAGFATKPKFFADPKDDYRTSRNVFGQKVAVGEKPFHFEVVDRKRDYFPAGDDGQEVRNGYVSAFMDQYADDVDKSFLPEDDVFAREEVPQEVFEVDVFDANDKAVDLDESKDEVLDENNFREPRDRIRSGADLDQMEPASPVKEFTKFIVSRDPYIAPYLASDEVLAKMPPISLLTSNLDPCLDDMVMFGKRLKYLNNRVKLDVIGGGLPHGFLNFCRFSEQAHQGSLLSVRRIDELLKGNL